MTTDTTAPAEAARTGGTPPGTLRRGDRVRVRPAAEILAGLDANGDLDGLPFMPEMLPLCGGEMVVQSRADKTCDTVNLLGCNRRMTGTVHLVGARCDGSAHGGCQAGCLLFVKEEWLERTAPAREPAHPVPAPAEAVSALRRAAEPAPGTYRCQATQLLAATTPMPRGDLVQYIQDVRTGNAPARKAARTFAYAVLNHYQRWSKRLPSALRVNDGDPLPRVRGRLDKTPRERLDLQPGELVEVRSREEIEATLDRSLRNRGLSFDVEMTRWCGRRARVLRRVERIVDEASGRMLELPNDCIVLEGVACEGDYHRLCPRQVYAYWREIWLRRVDEPAAGARSVR
ncbi:MAG TPA: hypothetical protein VK894_01470 [Jiangellales bacterium]|nr:hypothetical protein [Jiangellales bacterium]